MNAIEFNGVSKKFKKGEQFDSLRDLIPNLVKGLFSRNGKGEKLEEKEFWALKDVSFEVKKGEIVGIIGPNGAGKSTVLKLLSRILRPTKGEIKVNGRLSALIEVGAGFHQDLTGRENIYLCGTIMGMRKREIDKKFDSIVDFSGIEEFIDTPVKRYSSGMYVRLGFAVAAHLDPEILLVDEVLAVGDAAFRKKCLGKMGDVAEEGRTVLFVSHNMGAISGLCNRCILIKNSEIVAAGAPSEVIGIYLGSSLTEQVPERVFPDESEKEIHIKRVAVVGESGMPSTTFDIFDQVFIEVDYIVREEIIGSNVALLLSRNGVDILTSFDVDHDEKLLHCREPGMYKARVKLLCPLKMGHYVVGIGCGIPNSRTIDSRRDIVHFDIEEINIDASHHGYSVKRAGVVASLLDWNTQKLICNTKEN